MNRSDSVRILQDELAKQMQAGDISEETTAKFLQACRPFIRHFIDKSPPVAGYADDDLISILEYAAYKIALSHDFAQGPVARLMNVKFRSILIDLLRDNVENKRLKHPLRKDTKSLDVCPEAQVVADDEIVQPLDTLIQKEDEQCITGLYKRFLKMLDEQDAKILTMNIYNNASSQEIASEFGMTTETAQHKVSVLRAKWRRFGRKHLNRGEDEGKT